MIDCTRFPFCKQEAARSVIQRRDISISEPVMDACTQNQLIHVSNHLLWHLHINTVESSHTQTPAGTQTHRPIEYELCKVTHAHLQPTPACHNITFNGHVSLAGRFSWSCLSPSRHFCSRKVTCFPDDIQISCWVSRLSEIAISRCKCHRVFNLRVF